MVEEVSGEKVKMNLLQKLFNILFTEPQDFIWAVKNIKKKAKA